MIKFIVAIDQKQGMADDHGIPWQGKVPSDLKFFRESTVHSQVLMGFRTYQEFSEPLSDRVNWVIVRPGTEKLRDGFEAVEDAKKLIDEATEDLWVIGGAGVFTQLLPYADELYITQLEGDFNCTKFFPDYKTDFIRKYQSEPVTEGGITFCFETWIPKEKAEK